MHRVVVLALDRVIPFDMAIPFQVFGDARGPLEAPLYDVRLAGRRKGPLRTSGGFSVQVPSGLSSLATADTIVVVGSDPAGAGIDLDVCRELRRAAVRGARLLSICTGAFVLAEAGLLDGRRATTHWRHGSRFRDRFPQVELDATVLYTEDGRVLTSAGAAAGIDLCLHVVDVDHGAGIANAVARSTVSAPHRHGGQAQFFESPIPLRSDVGLERTREWARRHLADAIGPVDMARQAAVSRRTLARRFRAEIGMTPLHWLLDQRLALARQLLEETDLSVDEIALRSGLGAAVTMRLHFRRLLGVSPLAYRSAFGQRSMPTTREISPAGAPAPA